MSKGFFSEYSTISEDNWKDLLCTQYNSAEVEEVKPSNIRKATLVNIRGDHDEYTLFFEGDYGFSAEFTTTDKDNVKDLVIGKEYLLKA